MLFHERKKFYNFLVFENIFLAVKFRSIFVAVNV